MFFSVSPDLCLGGELFDYILCDSYIIGHGPNYTRSFEEPQAKRLFMQVLFL